MRKTILSFLVFALALASTVGYANSSYAPTSKAFTRLSQLPNIGKNPVYATRGLLLDNARKNYPLPWIKKLVTYMSKLELNQIQLHFSDIEAVRIQSKKHPEINSNPQLSQNRFKKFIKIC